MQITNTDFGKHGGKNSRKFDITALVVDGTLQTYVHVIHIGLTIPNMSKIHPLPIV